MSTPIGQGGGPYGPPSTPLPTVTVGGSRPPSRRDRNIAIVAAALLGVATIGLIVKALAIRGDIDDRDSTIEEVRRDNGRLDDRISDLEDDATTDQDDLAAARSQIESLTADLDDVTTDIDAAEEDLAAAEARVRELEAAATSTTTTVPTTTAAPADTTAATAPPDMTLPSLPPEISATFNDGIIDDVELITVNEYIQNLPDLNLEQAQDIADHLCAATSPPELGTVLAYVEATYFPGAAIVDVAYATSAVGISACTDVLDALTAG